MVLAVFPNDSNASVVTNSRNTMRETILQLFAVLAAATVLAPPAGAVDPAQSGPLALPSLGQASQGGAASESGRFDRLEQRVHELEIRRLPPVYQETHFDRFANGSSVADDLDDLSQSVADQGEAIGSLGSDMKAKVNSGHSGATMKVSGRIHADYWAFPGDSPAINLLETNSAAMSPPDRFLFRRIRFGVAGDVTDNMQYKIEMEFAEGNNVEFRDVYLGFKHLPVLHTLLIGNQKRPYGLDHMNSSRYNIFLERPWVIEGFNEDTRRLGVASYGVSPDQVYNWRYGIYNMRKIADEGNYTNDDYQLEFASRLASTYWYDESSGGRGYGHFAVSSTLAFPDGTAPNNGTQDNEARFRNRPEGRSQQRWLDTGRIAGAHRYSLLGIEKGLNLGPVQIIGEYQNVFLRRDSGFGTTRDLHFHGGYAYITYMLTGEHVPWDRKSGNIGRVKPFENFFLVERDSGGIGGGWGAWQLAFRYSLGDFTDADIQGGVGQSYTLGLNWWWNPYARLQINWSNGYIEQRGPLPGEAFVGQIAGAYDVVGSRFLIDF